MTFDPERAMHRASTIALASYMARDPILALLDHLGQSLDEGLTCQKWLRSTPAKRYGAQVLYGDLLTSRGRNILDVGGGLTSLTRVLAERHRYTLVDLMAHDDPATVADFLGSCVPFSAITCDWAAGLPGTPFDIVIAADLFPNVDQRLDAFLAQVLPMTGELRLSLTWHDPPRQDLVRRVNGDEMMCMLGWSGEQILRSLSPLQAAIPGYEPSVFAARGDSIYPNGRQVCYVSIREKSCP